MAKVMDPIHHLNSIIEKIDVKTDIALSELRNLTKKFSDLNARVKDLESCSGKTDGTFALRLAETVNGIVGLREAALSKHKLLQLLWSTLFVIGIGATGLYMYETIQDYQTGPTATNVWFDRSSSFDYPPLVFCTDGWIDENKARATNLSIDAIKYSLGYFDNYHDIKVQNAASAKMEFVQYFSRHFSFLPDFYKSIAIDFQETIAPSQFRSATKPAYFCRKCDKSHPTEKVFLTSGGVCHRMIMVKGDGYTSDNIYMKTFAPIQNLYFKPYPAWYLFYSHDNDLEITTSSYLLIPPSVYTFVKVSVKRYDNLEMKKGAPNCVSKEYQWYSQPRCISDCERREYIKEFQCIRPVQPAATATQLTELCNFQDNYADNTTSPDYYLDVSKTIARKCFKECQPKCKRIYYDVSLVSQFDLAGSDFEGVLDPETTANVSVVALNVQHGAISEGGVLTYTELNTYSFTDLVNNIGGTLGLFIGGTMMTLAQLVVFLVSLVYEKARAKFRD